MSSTPIVRRRGDQDSKPNDNLMVGSRAEMVSIAWQQALKSVDKSAPPAEDLVATTLPEGAPRRQEQGAYFFGHRTIRWSVRGVVSKVGKVQFAAMVATGIHHALKAYSEIWPAEWSVVGLVLEDTVRPRLDRRGKEDPAKDIAWQAQAASVSNASDAIRMSNKTPTASQKNELAMVNEDDLVLHLAITDLTQRPIFDPLQREKPGNTSGGMFQYGETGRLSDLPRSFRAQRDAAIDVVLEFHGLKEATGVAMPKLTDKQRDDIVKMARFASGEQIARAFQLDESVVDGVLDEAHGQMLVEQEIDAAPAELEVPPELTGKKK